MTARCSRGVWAAGLAALTALAAAAGLWIAVGVSTTSVDSVFLARNATQFTVTVEDAGSFNSGLRFYTGGRAIWHRCATNPLNVESGALRDAVAVPGELSHHCAGLLPGWLRSYGPGMHTFAIYDFPRDRRGQVVPGTYRFWSDTTFWAVVGITESAGPPPAFNAGLLAAAASLSGVAVLLGGTAAALACRERLRQRKALQLADAAAMQAPSHAAVVGHVFLNVGDEVSAASQAHEHHAHEHLSKLGPGAACRPNSAGAPSGIVVVVGRPVDLAGP